MPETEVGVVFSADASQVRQAVGEIETELKELQSQTSAAQYLKFGTASPEAKAAYWKEQASNIKEVQAGMSGLEEAAGRFENQISRILTRMAAFAMVSGAVKLAWEGIKDLMDVQQQETTWRNLIDDSERGTVVFEELTGAMHDMNTGLDQGVAGVRQLVAAGETVPQATTEVEKLAEVAKVLGVPLKEITAEIAKIREEGTITFGELIKLNEQTGGLLKDQVAQWRADTEMIKSYTEAVRVADKAQQEITTTLERTISTQSSFADKIGLTKQVYDQLQSSIKQAHPEYARTDAGLVAEQQNRLMQSQMAANLRAQMAEGISAMAKQTGMSEADIQRYVAGGQLKPQELISAAREQRAEAERLRTEGERETIAKMKQEQTDRQRAIAAAVPGRIEDMPGLTQKFQATMSTWGSFFGQVGEQAKQAAENLPKFTQAFKDSFEWMTGQKPAGYTAGPAPGIRMQPFAPMFGLNVAGMEAARMGAGAGAAAIANTAVEKNTGDTNSKLDQLISILSAAMGGGT